MTGVFYECHSGNTGVERTPNKSQHTTLTLEKKISRRSCRDSNSQPFDRESGALTNKLSRCPCLNNNRLSACIGNATVCLWPALPLLTRQPPVFLHKKRAKFFTYLFFFLLILILNVVFVCLKLIAKSSVVPQRPSRLRDR